MPTEIQGEVGVRGLPISLATGTITDVALGNQAQVMTQDWGPSYAEMAARGVLFSGANQASQAISHLNATATGLILINPQGSGVNLWIVEIQIIQTSVAAATADAGIVLAANSNPEPLASYSITSALNANSALVGAASNAKAKLGSQVTLPAAPSIIRAIWQPSVSGTATTGIPSLIKDEVKGAVGVAPGCAVSLSANSALSAIASITWAELPAAA